MNSNFFNKEFVNLSGGQFFVTAEDRHLWNVFETLKEFTLPVIFSFFSQQRNRHCSVTDTHTHRMKIMKTLAFQFSFIFIVLAHENNWLGLGISSREICRKPTGQKTAGSFLINFTSHAIKRRTLDLGRCRFIIMVMMVIECLKKKCRYFAIEVGK